MYKVVAYHKDENKNLVKYSTGEVLTSVDAEDVDAWRSKIISNTPAKELKQAPVLLLITKI